MKLNIIGNRKWFLSLSAIFVGLSIASIAWFGFTPGIDFQSGTMWQISVPGVDERAIRDFAETNLELDAPIISYDPATDSFTLIFREITPEEHIVFQEALRSQFTESKEMDFGTTSPSVSAELKNNAIWIIVLVLVAITLYVTFMFRKVLRPVKSYKYGLVTLVALMHDILIAAGFFAIVGYFQGVTIDTFFIVALLTVAGFSVQDTIVIFDRIREKLSGQKGKVNFNETAEKSIHEVFRRSVNTAIGAMIALLVVAIFGPASMKYFTLTMLVGMFFGIYSSIFVASPLLTLWHDFDAKRASSVSDR